MRSQTVQKIVNEIFPKIEKHYGYSKFIPECTPYVELHHSIYERLSGESCEDTDGEQSPHAEFDRTDNSIVLYYPNMVSRKHIIQTLIHEYQHYLQSPIWMERYYNMGYHYGNHPYEVQAYNEEKNWVLFN